MYPSTCDPLHVCFFKAELTPAEEKIAAKTGDLAVKSVIRQMVESQMGMESLIKECTGLLTKCREQKVDCHEMKELRDALRALRRFTAMYDDAVNFSTDENQEPLTNATAFVILGQGGQALEDTLEKAEVAKTKFKMAKQQREAELLKFGSLKGARK